MKKTFIEMYCDGWCEHCIELEQGECSKTGICKAYVDYENSKNNKDEKEQSKKEDNENGKKSI